MLTRSVYELNILDHTASSPQLRHLLTTTALPRILSILDSVNQPDSRSNALARLLGLDRRSLAKPSANPLLSQRDSPPPLEDLLRTLAGEKVESVTESTDGDAGWWLGDPRVKDKSIWIGDEERKVMRLFANVVCQAIDGSEGEEAAWGQGELAWEV